LKNEAADCSESYSSRVFAYNVSYPNFKEFVQRVFSWLTSKISLLALDFFLRVLTNE